MSRFGKIESSLWAEQAWASLGVEPRVLYLWAISNPRNTPAGLYPCADRLMAFESGVDIRQLPEILGDLERTCYLFYRDGVVWIPDYVNQYLAHTGKGEKHKAGILHALHTVPEAHELRTRWFEAYSQHPALQAELREAFPSLSEAPTRTMTMTSASASTNGGRGSKAETEFERSHDDRTEAQKAADARIAF